MDAAVTGVVADSELARRLVMGGEQLAAMADRGDAEPDQILGRKVHEDLGVDVVLPERLFVLSQPQATQPSRDVHGCLRAPGAQGYCKMSGRAGDPLLESRPPA